MKMRQHRSDKIKIIKSVVYPPASDHRR